jgi:hypothetical protein
MKQRQLTIIERRSSIWFPVWNIWMGENIFCNSCAATPLCDRFWKVWCKLNFCASQKGVFGQLYLCICTVYCMYIHLLYILRITHITIYIYKGVLKMAPWCMTNSGITFPHTICIIQIYLLHVKVHDGNDFQVTHSWLHVNGLLNMVWDSYLEIANSAQQV